jgi:anti-sigma factor RsiW
MTSQDSCLHVRQALGVYVVGAIDPAERSMVDMHLAGCLDCREELAGLAGLPALLGRIPLDEAAQLAGFSAERAMPADHPDAGQPPPELLTPLLAKAAHRRRVSRWRNLAAAAAVVVIAAGAALGATQLSQAPSGGSPVGTVVHWDSAQGMAPATGVTADIKYRGQPWGTQLVAQVSGVKPGTTCQFWVIGGHGQKWLAGSWTVASAWQSQSYAESVAAQVTAVHGFQITSGARVLVQANAH